MPHYAKSHLPLVFLGYTGGAFLELVIPGRTGYMQYFR